MVDNGTCQKVQNILGALRLVGWPLLPTLLIASNNEVSISFDKLFDVTGDSLRVCMRLVTPNRHIGVLLRHLSD